MTDRYQKKDSYKNSQIVNNGVTKIESKMILNTQ